VNDQVVEVEQEGGPVEYSISGFEQVQAQGVEQQHAQERDLVLDLSWKAWV
jgi:hypothetical protein